MKEWQKPIKSLKLIGFVILKYLTVNLTGILLFTGQRKCLLLGNCQEPKNSRTVQSMFWLSIWELHTHQIYTQRVGIKSGEIPTIVWQA